MAHTLINMKTKFFNTAVLICFLFVVAIINDLSGKWVGAIVTPDGTAIDLTYNFKVDGDKVTGTALSPAGVVDIENGKIADDKFTFSVNVNGVAYPHTGKLYADSCGLDIDFGNGAKVHTKLIRPAK